MGSDLENTPMQSTAEAMARFRPHVPSAMFDLLVDETVSEIMTIGPGRVFIERGGKMESVEVEGLTESGLSHIPLLAVRPQGGNFGEDHPVLDCRLPDGSRLAAVCPPASPHLGLTIRKFHYAGLRLPDLVRLGALDETLANRLSKELNGGANLIISGGTGTGKTTLLTALLAAIPIEERIVSCEDTIEIEVPHENHLPLETRGRKDITIRQLVKAALRHRPDHLVVGEVRGAESYDLLQAFNTGHGGSLATVHANHPLAAMNRLAHMAMQAEGVHLEFETACRMVAEGVQIVVQVSRARDGRRGVSSVLEIEDSLSGEQFRTRTLFASADSHLGANAGTPANRAATPAAAG